MSDTRQLRKWPNRLWVNGRWLMTAPCRCGAHSEAMANGRPCPMIQWRPSRAHGPVAEAGL